MFDTVVVGADDSPAARRAVETAVDITRMSSGPLRIASVFAAKSNGASSDTSFSPVEGDAADVVINEVDEIAADLAEVGNRGMKGVRRVLGTVPSSVVHGANCSVRIVDTTE